MMELIIDANVLMSAIIATQGKTYDLMYNDRIKLFAPEYLMDEFRKYEREILSKSGLSKSDFELFLSLMNSRIEFISKSSRSLLNSFPVTSEAEFWKTA